MQIETVSGRQVDVSNPLPDDIVLDDIAWALSRMARFAGHTVTEIPYNVAQHSVYVSELSESLVECRVYGTKNDWTDVSIPEEIDRALKSIERDNVTMLYLNALLHDGHEAYIGDLPSPIKRIPSLTEVFKQIETGLDAAIRTKLSLEHPSQPEQLIIKFCDKFAQAVESYQFMPSRGRNWQLPVPSLVQLQRFPEPQSSILSYEGFLLHYEYLRGQ